MSIPALDQELLLAGNISTAGGMSENPFYQSLTLHERIKQKLKIQ